MTLHSPLSREPVARSAIRVQHDPMAEMRAQCVALLQCVHDLVSGQRETNGMMLEAVKASSRAMEKTSANEPE